MLNRFPKLNEILPVLAFTSFLVYGRMFYVFVWKMPSWLKFLTAEEILSGISYSLAFDLLESLSLTLLLVAISFILPSPWFRDVFVTRSTWLMTVWMVSLMIYFDRLSKLGLDFLIWLIPWTAVTLIVALLAAFFAANVRVMHRAALWIADRTIVFLFLFIPASLVGAVVVATRNIF